MWAGWPRLKVQCKVVHIATFPGGWAAGATYGWGGRHWVLLMGTVGGFTHMVHAQYAQHANWSRWSKQRMQCALSPSDVGTHHSHIILLAVCRVGAGDALCRNGSTRLGGHGIHSSPEAKQTGPWVQTHSTPVSVINTLCMCVHVGALGNLSFCLAPFTCIAILILNTNVHIFWPIFNHDGSLLQTLGGPHVWILQEILWTSLQIDEWACWWLPQKQMNTNTETEEGNWSLHNDENKISSTWRDEETWDLWQWDVILQLVLHVWPDRSAKILWSPYVNGLKTHMGRVQDMVTGLLNGSSSIIPLFFKSRGVGFAVENETGHRQRKPMSWYKHQANNVIYVFTVDLWELVFQKLTFPVRFEVAVDGWWGDITKTTVPVAQGGAASLTGR